MKLPNSTSKTGKAPGVQADQRRGKGAYADRDRFGRIERRGLSAREATAVDRRETQAGRGSNLQH